MTGRRAPVTGLGAPLSADPSLPLRMTGRSAPVTGLGAPLSGPDALFWERQRSMRVPLERGQSIRT